MSVYAVSDLHGHLALFLAIQNYLKPEDTLYVLGDCGDRGPEPWNTIKEVFADPRCIYIKGNHEDMLVKAIRGYAFGNDQDIQTLIQNGGYETMQQCLESPYYLDWVNKIDHLPSIATYKNKDGYNIILTHAGFTPIDNKVPCEEDLLWDRQHFLDNEFENNTIIVHGHTPIPFVADILQQTWTPEDGSLWYNENHKICIDCGTQMTKATILLDLDIFDEHIFHF